MVEVPNPKKRTGTYDEKTAIEVNIKTRALGFFDAYDAYWFGNIDTAKFKDVLMRMVGYDEQKADGVIRAMG
jgi:hypothetical protein